ncbi:hypothetical protein Y032_0065g3591 [Ancylostoma ceylanicum]|uniref:Uncharacterized protein n=1 Tax=Ancylostoma ceylanicum TaxID=53326 RepID=A0A016U0B3_9BILA|nr:hypothetical protein Y032_0065g3591 [Ancylostoma ceylanicum]
MQSRNQSIFLRRTVHCRNQRIEIIDCTSLSSTPQNSRTGTKGELVYKRDYVNTYIDRRFAVSSVSLLIVF